MNLMARDRTKYRLIGRHGGATFSIRRGGVSKHLNIPDDIHRVT